MIIVHSLHSMAFVNFCSSCLVRPSDCNVFSVFIRDFCVDCAFCRSVVERESNKRKGPGAKAKLPQKRCSSLPIEAFFSKTK